MMMNTTLTQLRTLKLDGLACGLEEQLTLPAMAGMSFEERLALLVDREIHCRNDRRLLRLLKNAQLKYAQAAIEDIDSRPERGIDRREVMSLALSDWVCAYTTPRSVPAVCWYRRATTWCGGENAANLSLYGQEMNLNTWAICKMNIFLHGVFNADIRKGDTLREPQHVEHGELMHFDRVIAKLLHLRIESMA